jgi:hypothetical protein
MRKCRNPECSRVTEDEHETICILCGWLTDEVEAKQEKKHGDRARYVDKLPDAG